MFWLTSYGLKEVFSGYIQKAVQNCCKRIHKCSYFSSAACGKWMICFKMYIHILSHKITSQKLSKNSHKNNWDNNSVFISYTAANSFFIKMTSNDKNLLLGLYLILYVSYSEVCFSYQSRGLKNRKSYEHV